jgi:hypothetical protein
MAAEPSAAYHPCGMPVQNSRFLQRALAWSRPVVVMVAVIAVGLLAGRVAPPSVVKGLMIGRLQRIPGYTGNVNDFGIPNNVLPQGKSADGNDVAKNKTKANLGETNPTGRDPLPRESSFPSVITAASAFPQDCDATPIHV